MRISTIFVLLSLALCLTAQATADVVYVDCNAPGPEHDGTSWDTAFLTIQQGVDAATPNGEVWVADGTYVENVVMGEGVQLYGGFLGAEPGGYEDSLDQRDFANNIATIDGNQSGSCVTMAVDARVDGFVVTKGTGTLVWVIRCGGGFFCQGLGPRGVIANNVITCNTATGAGIWCYESSPLITGNEVSQNVGGDGGGIYCKGYSSPTIDGNIITGNRFSGIYCVTWASPVIRGNLITANSGEGKGGGIHSEQHSSPVVTGNVVQGNTGFGMEFQGSGGAPRITDNLISANEGGGIRCTGSCEALLANNLIEANSGWLGGGVYCGSNSRATVIGNTIRYNSVCEWGAGGGGICLEGCGCNVAVSRNTICLNSSSEDGGGIMCSSSSQPTLADNIIYGNSAAKAGGAIFCRGAYPQVVSCTMADNSAATGAALACDSFQQEPSQVTLANCILWNGGDEIWRDENSTVTVVYSDIWGGWPGEGNLDTDPLFVDPENGDYHLLPDSPCIDAGSNDYVLTDEDIDGDPRIIWAMRFPVPYWPHPGYVDIGADEFVPTGVSGLGRQDRGQAFRPQPKPD